MTLGLIAIVVIEAAWLLTTCRKQAEEGWRMGSDGSSLHALVLAMLQNWLWAWSKMRGVVVGGCV